VRIAGPLPLLILGALLAAAACGAPPSTTPPPATQEPTGEPAPPQPPLAVLTFPGGRPVAGELGTYIYRGAGSDSPWLPGEPVAVPPSGAQAEVFLSEAIPIASWTARLGPTGRAPEIGEPRQIATGEDPIVFELPTGAWTLELTVEFADGIGSATYFWALSQG
jgi:hypothetical protein